MNEIEAITKRRRPVLNELVKEINWIRIVVKAVTV